jgi:hypothetical protein
MSAKKTVEKLSPTRARASMSTIDVWCRFDEAKDITSLTPNPRNPNTHGDKQIALLAKIIRNQGWRQPITVSNRSGFIVKGHGRLMAAQLLQVEQVPVEFQDYATEAAEYADLIADNRIAELAEVDNEMLSGLLNDAKIFDGFDLELTGCIKPETGQFEKAFSQDAKESIIMVPIMILKTEEEYIEFSLLKDHFGIKKDEDMFSLCIQKTKELI